MLIEITRVQQDQRLATPRVRHAAATMKDGTKSRRMTWSPSAPALGRWPSVPAAAKGRSRARTALNLAGSLLLAGALFPAPARADYEWFQKHGTNNWTTYDYMNYARETSLDDINAQFFER